MSNKTDEEIDESMELILKIVNDETNWKRSQMMTDVLNIEGVLRVRITDILKSLTTNE